MGFVTGIHFGGIYGYITKHLDPGIDGWFFWAELVGTIGLLLFGGWLAKRSPAQTPK